MSRWHEELETLVADRGHALIAYAFLVSGNRSEAEDLVQDALVKVFAKSSTVREPWALETYVRRSILTTYVDGFRRRRRWGAIRHLNVRPERDWAAEVEPFVTTAMELHEALSGLSPRERACVILRYYEDLSVRDTAAALGLAEGTVKRYLSDALAKLEAHLGPIDHDARDSDDLETVSVTERRRSWAST